MKFNVIFSACMSFIACAAFIEAGDIKKTVRFEVVLGSPAPKGVCRLSVDKPFVYGPPDIKAARAAYVREQQELLEMRRAAELLLALR